MKEIRWNPLKSARLKMIRGMSFEDLIGQRVVKIRRHPQKPNQDVMIFEIAGYLWIVPFVEDERGFFLKTLYQSRKYTKLYKEGKL